MLWVLSPSSGAPFGIVTGDDLRRQVNDVGARAGGPGQEVVDLVPRQPFVGRDVDRLSDRARVSQQPHQPPRKVLVMGERPD